MPIFNPVGWFEIGWLFYGYVRVLIFILVPTAERVGVPRLNRIKFDLSWSEFPVLTMLVWN